MIRQTSLKPYADADEISEVNPLDEVSTNLPVAMDSWPALLPLQIAEHEASIGSHLYSIEEIAEHFDISVKQIEVFKDQRSFRAEVRAALLEIKDTNSVIRQKAKAQFEHYLDVYVPLMMNDPMTPPAEKLKLFQFLAKTARVVDDPAEKAKADAKALPTDKATTLNLYLQSPSGDTQKISGITIDQTETPEELPNGS